MQLPVFARAPHPLHPDISVAFFLDFPWMDIRRNGGPRAKIGDLRTAMRVIGAPWKVFEKCDLIYLVGKPPFQFVDDVVTVPASPNSLFVVELNQGMLIMNCDWISLPIKYANVVVDSPEEHFLSTLGREVQHAY
jgi:hypothetical protein